MAEELTLEQLHGIVSDPESEKQVAQSLQLPVGTYSSTPELNRRITQNEETGRRSARFFGAFKGIPDGETEATEGRAAFTVSWEPRYKTGEKDGQGRNVLSTDPSAGKADLQTKLYADAKNTYRKAMGMGTKDPVALTDVLDFLSKYSVGVRFGQGDNDNIAFAITTAKEYV